MGLLKRLAKSLFGSFLSPARKTRGKKKRPGKRKTIRSRKAVRKKVTRKVFRRPKKRALKRPQKKRSHTVPKRKKAIKVRKKKRGGVPSGIEIGEIRHYFSHIQVAVLKITAGELRLLDPICIKGHTTLFRQTVGSMQMNHKPIERAVPGDEIGIQVRKRVREGDKIFKLG